MRSHALWQVQSDEAVGRWNIRKCLESYKQADQWCGKAHPSVQIARRLIQVPILGLAELQLKAAISFSVCANCTFSTDSRSSQKCIPNTLWLRTTQKAQVWIVSAWHRWQSRRWRENFTPGRSAWPWERSNHCASLTIPAWSSSRRSSGRTMNCTLSLNFWQVYHAS